ncbi:MAG: tyrosine-type recombinase/integrase [Lachnospiraceae bacterium]|nr:tyrosine-type recombinase/integrase [Lachnospiraceae bacterium]
MKSYDETVDDMMLFLKNKDVCLSSINSHRSCYKQFQQFMHEHGKQWKTAVVSDWISELKQKEPASLYSIWNQYMQQLEELNRTGTVLDRHLYLNRSTYDRLNETMRSSLDDFLLAYKDHYRSRSYLLARNKLAGMLLFFEDHGRITVSDISYPDIISYYSSDFCFSAKTRTSYLGHARRFFAFMSDQKKCPVGYSLFLNDKYAPYVGDLNKFDEPLKKRIAAVADESQAFPAVEFLNAVNDYIDSLRSHGYGTTSLMTAKHALTVLYLFLDIHSLGYHPEISYAWFAGVMSSLPKNWKHWRRLIYLFSEYCENGDIIPSGKYTYGLTAIDVLPEWCRSRIEDFLDLLKREFHDAGTIRTYRYPCIRLCGYLVKQNYSGFESINAGIIQKFCHQDQHKTFKGKSTCLGGIRRFIVFLEDTGYIKNKNLHLCIDPGCAPDEKVVDVLTEVQCQRIEQYRECIDNPIALRRIAMVMIGIKMGLRASDVINLKLKDIDWMNRSISIIQKKTKSSLTLPLPISVGNAIYRYIKEGRPQVHSDYVFIRHKAPYGKLTNKTCTIALWSILPERKSICGGFHVTRRTFATNILRSGAGAGDVMDTLGHTDPTSVMKYLSMDEDRMRQCPLALSDFSLIREEV